MNQKLINILFAIAIIGIALLNLRHEKTPTQTQPINYELLEYRFNQSEKRIDTLYSQMNLKDTIIYENSNLVRTANRSKRDSIRAIVNPR